ncbi:hypothetical protein KKF59_01740 [Patescibacteria group bacterium]|nr:hypothetical protein [Patescibacteria group bacterium]MBU1907835.1 hypothetical protein [Patescibacteria group bacterium]
MARRDERVHYGRQRVIESSAAFRVVRFEKLDAADRLERYIKGAVIGEGDDHCSHAFRHRTFFEGQQRLVQRRLRRWGIALHGTGAVHDVDRDGWRANHQLVQNSNDLFLVHVYLFAVWVWYIGSKEQKRY